MNKLLGDKNIFAIEYNNKAKTGLPFGVCFLWIGGRVIGSEKSQVYFHSVSDCFYTRVNEPERISISPKINVSNVKDMWRYLKGNHREYSILEVEEFEYLNVYVL